MPSVIIEQKVNAIEKITFFKVRSEATRKIKYEIQVYDRLHDEVSYYPYSRIDHAINKFMFFAGWYSKIDLTEKIRSLKV